MDLSKLRRGAGRRHRARLLFIVMFFSWYGVDVGPISDALLDRAGVDTTATAWQAFDILDLFLLLTLVVGAHPRVPHRDRRAPSRCRSAQRDHRPCSASSRRSAWLYRILNQPGQNDVVQVKIGAWLGLLLCAGIAVGGYLAMRDEGTTFDQALSSARRVDPGPPGAAR